jgi:two-component system, NtrC family, nitrogen regulation response regulator NtrX
MLANDGSVGMAKHILVIDDEPAIRELVAEILQDEGYRVSVAENAAAARLARRAQRADAILLDVWMPDTDGISLLKEWSQAGDLDAPVVMMSGHGTVETAVEATRLGAYDFIEKPISLAKLLITLERAIEANVLKQENLRLKTKADPLLEPKGNSRAMQELRQRADKVAAHDAWVLIEGEAGTGKAQLARYLHAKSARADAPFVVVTPGSIAQENAARELFGSENSELRYGLIERAQSGTLYLDEVSELDLELQLKLAGALSQRAITRLGGQSPVALDIRVIASSSKSLEAEVRAKRFREDLYYALNVVPLRTVPLRDRPEDIPELARALAESLAASEGLPYRKLTVAAQNRLRQHSWSGNVRELKNLLQRLLIMGEGAEIEHAEVEHALSPLSPEKPAGLSELAVDLAQPLREAREQFERAYLLYHLKLAGGSVGKLARIVDVERTHLYRKLRSLGVELKESEST